MIIMLMKLCGFLHDIQHFLTTGCFYKQHAIFFSPLGLNAIYLSLQHHVTMTPESLDDKL
mgnify:CR=1 FL=1